MSGVTAKDVLSGYFESRQAGREKLKRALAEKLSKKIPGAENIFGLKRKARKAVLGKLLGLFGG